MLKKTAAYPITLLINRAILEEWAKRPASAIKNRRMLAGK